MPFRKTRGVPRPWVILWFVIVAIGAAGLADRPVSAQEEDCSKSNGCAQEACGTRSSQQCSYPSTITCEWQECTEECFGQTCCNWVEGDNYTDGCVMVSQACRYVTCPCGRDCP